MKHLDSKQTSHPETLCKKKGNKLYQTNFISFLSRILPGKVSNLGTMFQGNVTI